MIYLDKKNQFFDGFALKNNGLTGSDHQSSNLLEQPLASFDAFPPYQHFLRGREIGPKVEKSEVKSAELSKSQENRSTVLALLGGVGLFVGVVAFGFISLPTAAALGVLAITVFSSGCDVYYSYGKGSKECDGKAAKEDVIQFEKGYLPGGEEEKATQEIKKITSNLRKINPDIFCKFNGIQVESGAAEKPDDFLTPARVAYYEPRDRTIHIAKGFSTELNHEMCHYFSDQYGVYHEGVYGSISPLWEKSSCILNGWIQSNPEKCIVASDFFKPYSDNQKYEEELAETCATVNILLNPIGSFYNYSSNLNTLQQIKSVMTFIGFPKNEIDKHSSNVSISSRPARLTEVINSPFALTSVNIRRIIPGGSESFIIDEVGGLTLFQLSTEKNRWISYQFTQPPDTVAVENGDFLISYAHGKNKLAAWYKGTLYLGVPKALFQDWTSKTFSRIPTSQKLVHFNETLAFVDNQLVYLGESNYWFLDDPSETPQEYSSELRKIIPELSDSYLTYADGKTFLWVEHVQDSSFGFLKTGILYRLEYQNSKLQFIKVFEIPTIESMGRPIFYEQKWYLFGKTNNSYLSSFASLDPYFKYFSLHGLGLINVEEQSGRVVSYEVRFSNDDSAQFRKINDITASMLKIYAVQSQIVGISSNGLFNLQLSF